MKLGIAICTYNRCETLMQTIVHIREHTKTPYELIVVDDGSTDATVSMAIDAGVRIMSSRNRGIAWNKNRALYYLKAIAKVDVLILLEDDTFPLEDCWENDWIRAITRWGHINLAARYWGKALFRDGSGSAERPYKSEHVSAQCAGFSAECIEMVGYMDSRFRGWGMEHVEHTNRMARAGFGGEPLTPIHRPVYYLIDSNMEILHREESVGVVDTAKKDLIAQSIEICIAISRDKTRRDPWINDEEMAVFLSEFNAFRGKDICFYLKDDRNWFMIRDASAGKIILCDQATFSTTTSQRVFTVYDGKVLRLCVEYDTRLYYVASQSADKTFPIVKEPSLALTLDVILDKVAGLYLLDRSSYVSCDRANGNTIIMDRQQASDWERFFFSHFAVIRQPLHPNFGPAADAKGA